MSLFNRHWRTLLLAVISISVLAQCQKEDKDTKNFNVDLISEHPLIRITKRDMLNFTVEPNWFDLTMKFTNTSDYDVRVEEILFYVRTDELEANPRSFDIGQIRTKVGDDTYITYSSYCTYPKDGRTYALSICSDPNLKLKDTTNFDPTNPAEAPYLSPWVLPLQIYIGGIENSVTFPNNLRYSVRMVIHGIKLDASGNDAGRFEKTLYFTTQ